MTRQEWLACDKPGPMLRFLAGRVSARKLLLFRCACCRRIWKHLRDPGGREAVRTAEHLAFGRASEEDLFHDAVGARDALEIMQFSNSKAARGAGGEREAALYAAVLATEGFRVDPEGTSRETSKRAALAVTRAAGGPAPREPDPDELRAQAALLREIVGDPFRPVAIDPGWLGERRWVARLARSIERGPAFEVLPALGDALRDAGCPSEEAIAHCHAGGPHARGCWLLDLLLGRE